MNEKFKSGPLNREPDSPLYEISEPQKILRTGPRRIPRDASERPPATPETKEKMDRELIALGNLMKDFKGWWQLDGALNMSLRQGQYIGIHADVDVSVLRKDIAELQEYLRERGYGFFRMNKKMEPDKKIFQRVGAAMFHKTETDWDLLLRFAAIDEQGKIRTDADLPAIEVAIIETDEENRPLNRFGVSMPKKWMRGETVNFHGVSMHLSNPARFLFNKIWFFEYRPYDKKDLELFAKSGAITLADVQEVKKVMEPTLQEIQRKMGKMEAEKRREWIRNVETWIVERKRK